MAKVFKHPRPTAGLGVALGLIVVTSLCSGCARRAGSVTELRTWMTGSFSSAAQHAADPDAFYDIRLHMVPIWPERDDGPWLYVEQAAAALPDRPYRQRVYQLRAKSDGTYESIVYTLPGDPLRFAEAWREPHRLEDVSPEDLDRRTGCRITLRKTHDGSYVGSTTGKECASTLRGAAYATSEVVITPEQLVSWDRGFDENDEQVWGATAGGYVFQKEAESNAPRH